MSKSKNVVVKEITPAPVAPAPVASAPVTPAPVDTPTPDTPAPDKKGRKSNAGNKGDGTFYFVRRNDNRVRIVSNGATLATVQVGSKLCSVHTPLKSDFDPLFIDTPDTPAPFKALEVKEVKMGPNNFKVVVDTPRIDTLLGVLFGTVTNNPATPDTPDVTMINEAKKEEA